jgi:hypothetical protein
MWRWLEHDPVPQWVKFQSRTLLYVHGIPVTEIMGAYTHMRRLIKRQYI